MAQKKPYMIYLVAGKARHGKSETGKIIKEEYERRHKKVVILRYAHYIKDYASSYFGWDGREETKPRELLDQIGDYVRVTLNKEYFFIERTLDDIDILSNFFDVFIIDDIRFVIEILSAQQKYNNNVVTVKVVRDNYKSDLTAKQLSHRTEVDLDHFESFDYKILNNGSLDDLKANVLAIIDEEEKKKHEEDDEYRN